MFIFLFCKGGYATERERNRGRKEGKGREGKEGIKGRKRRK